VAKLACSPKIEKILTLVKAQRLNPRLVSVSLRSANHSGWSAREHIMRDDGSEAVGIQKLHSTST